MAARSSIDARATLRKLFSNHRLRAMARSTGTVLRRRKGDPVALFWTVVLGFGGGRTRSIAGLRRSYERATGECLEESSFYKRFNAGFAAMLEQALVHGLTYDRGTGRGLRGHLSRFVDVLITDATVLRVHELLSRHWPGSRTNHTPAAVKAHWVMSVAGKSRQSVKLTSERRHDGPVLQVGPWVKGRLMLFDLGYYGFSLFERIDRNGGYFISRLKAGANPLIVGLNRCERGGSVVRVGEKLQDVLVGLRREVLDVDIEVRVVHRRYAGQRRSVRKVFRLIGVRDPDTGQRHLYLTNARPEQLAAEHVQQSYALRWEVELLFRELKSHYRLDQLPSRKPEVVKALIYAAALTLLVSRCLLDSLRQSLRSGAERLKTQRWAALVCALAADLLVLMVHPPRETRALHRRLNKLLLHEAPDPNVSRLSLLQAVESGVHQYRRALPA